MKIAAILSASLCLAAALLAQSGYDRSNLDTSCKPCDDFWRYANGGWLDRNSIPARYPSWGTMQVMRDGNRERLRAILEAASANKAAKPGSNEKRIGDLYAGCMDTARIDSLGAAPIQPLLDRVAAIASVRDLAAVLVEFHRSGAASPVGLMSMQDLKNSKEVIAAVMAGGISLPDRDYYLKDDARSKLLRDEFVKHVARMLVLAGGKPDAAAAGARAILDLETAQARVMMTNVQRRDPYARYHRMDFAALSALTPDFDWKPVFRNVNVPESTAINVAEPDVLKQFNSQLKAAPLDTWRVWLRWRVASAAAPRLSKPFFDENFSFTAIMTGVKEQEPRWQTCADAVDRSLGDALGQAFVEKHYPPEAGKRMNELVENLRVTLREELAGAAWLEESTRANAVKKLNAFIPKIGYPRRWRDYSAVKIDSKSYLESVRSASLAARAHQIAKIGKPVDRNDWGMTPPTVNAYYSPLLNEIAFPAGILQPPMFDVRADDAMNYGAIGAVIGHEMGHGFDDQGSKFDAEGNLKDWWTGGDRKKFEARAACVIDEFNALDVGDGLRHNGKLVVGEALGDLGGLTLAFKAWQRSLGGKPAPVIDGFTGEQRFFLAFARVWGAQYRAEAVRLQLNTNPHPLPRFRAIGTLQNVPAFHKAFDCKAGDAMVRPPDKQCKLW
ncbi:MAG: M13 family metallopeptidase [Candidatus Solibacter usitatus]|nr:M13 family metallopeptidase [Candidatus Solibacter usitatus]